MKALRMFLWMLVLTGVVYPLLITAIGHFFLHKQVNGSIIVSNGVIVGSALIGQHFESEKYFWPRPSAVDYNTLPSGASNLGPTSLELKKAAEKRKAHFAFQKNIPSELLFASGSGLDPHISPETADFQIRRIAQARNMDSETLKKWTHSFIEKRRFGFLGEPCLNVLKLNLALDAWSKKSE